VREDCQKRGEGGGEARVGRRKPKKKNGRSDNGAKNMATGKVSSFLGGMPSLNGRLFEEGRPEGA